MISGAARQSPVAAAAIVTAIEALGGHALLARREPLHVPLLTPVNATDTARAALEALKLPPGTSVANPIDAPVRTMQEEDGRVANRILDFVYRLAAPDALVMHLNLAAFVGRGGVDPVDNLIQAALDMQTTYPDQVHFLLVLRTDGSPELEERRRTYRRAALDIGIPVYDEIANAAGALAAVGALEERFGV